MRISDWSSDVCSSDLIGDPHDAPPEAGDEALDYRLDQQVGFLLRRAHQHASEVFQSKIGNRNLTPQQFSVLVTLLERREIAQTRLGGLRSEEHTSELQSLMRISYAVFCLKKKKNIDEIADVLQHEYPLL